jgi:GTP-binding protein YchF
MEIGIIGLPNVGKSTIFSLLTKISVPIENFPFTTIEPNVGIVEVPDENLDFLASLFKPKKKTYASIKFVDIAGLIKGASNGEGLGNKFLASIREVDAVVQVLRFFSDTSVASTISKVDPIEEIKIITTELSLADLEVLQNYKNKVAPKARLNDKIAKERLEIVENLINTISKANSLQEIKDFISVNIKTQDKEIISLLKQLLVNKDIIYLINYDEGVRRREIDEMKNKIEKETNSKTLSLCGKFELSLTDFPLEEQKSLREEYNIPETELKDFIKESAKVLHLITFYTTVGEEFRAWLIKENSNILDAAGKIHTDIREGFINAEVYNISHLKQYNDLKLLHQQGLIRIEGKDYIVKDGDVIKINFHNRT